MPVVPSNNVIPMRQPQAEPPPKEFLLMAGATMGDHAAQREEAINPIIRMSDFVEPHTITAGPEYDKWDETLESHGSIRIPKDLDNPQKWMNQHDKRLQDNNISREDRDDGSVILRKTGPTS